MEQFTSNKCGSLTNISINVPFAKYELFSGLINEIIGLMESIVKKNNEVFVFPALSFALI